ncbi:phosphoribosylamine--glycine ligase [Helicobacter ailurogastricus]|uniref:phosphoribosylamine--glycine ligase n=1 Tax=Helicobacter ailurogastricus TaxID=1578720 RepID=UPI000CF16F51|nr:phosphoribosylamine--glycine ligase [Helicobacter ailurogastricus]GLH58109.1 Phosphoribosylamine--glycine ligase PurD [Helicobacter ailurogastricus]GLH58934.1 Phosphoribosylamine--glycine ligase PurD [Helicobacter ailurogastricus]GMB89462.1 Phosphoribosylamine--glycine ligase PurD [Helicobacter ailurogastricus]
MKRKVLIIGGGAREYALGRKLKEDPRVSELFFCPGNGGTQSIGENVLLQDFAQIAAFAQEKMINLIVVGPEEPLVGGLVDVLQKAGVAVFGPSQKASVLEGSKSFTKALATAHKIPTAPYFIATHCKEALARAKILGFPVVLKADGLAQGKGVIVAQSEEEAQIALENLFKAHSKVVLEKFLEGLELSVLAFVSGQDFLLLPACHDYKKLHPNGPNTGGMGAFAPSHLCDDTLKEKIIARIFKPTLKAMQENNTPFVGVLYAGLMLVEENGQLEPYLLEFNVRFGDPECSVLLPLLKTPLLDLIEATMQGNLDQIPLELHPQHALGVVLACKDYPRQISHGQSIYIDPIDEKNACLDLGKIAQENGVFLVAGGRVCVCVGWGKSLTEAKSHAYHLVKKVQFEGMQFREDIGVL